MVDLERSPLFLKVSDLRLGDVVQLYDGPFGTATVFQIKDDVVHMERPYGATADFTCTSGVIAYIGHEHVRYPRDGAQARHTFRVWSRKELK